MTKTTQPTPAPLSAAADVPATATLHSALSPAVSPLRRNRLRIGSPATSLTKANDSLYRQKATSMLVVLALVLATVVLVTPSASAHQCQAEIGTPNHTSCEATCTDGEDHHHKVTHHHENGLGEDYEHTHYECSSTSKPPEPPTPPACRTPKILGLCVIDYEPQIAIVSPTA